MRLVLVDDHYLFREGLATIIQEQPDIEIIGMAGSVQEAVEAARDLKPDIILMDFSLPDGTGVDATRQILHEHPACKIIFLTMSEEDENLFAAVRSGAKGYLLKTMKAANLISAIRSVYQGESAISRSMTLRLMEELMQTRSSIPAAALTTLTSRELDVLHEMAQGKTNTEIAQKLFLSANTIKYHVHSILEKLGVADRKAAVQYARENGLLQ